jgi:type I restriction-modification system DNA methylase subunit
VAGRAIVDASARLCVMNLYLHGIDPDDSPITVADRESCQFSVFSCQ